MKTHNPELGVFWTNSNPFLSEEQGHGVHDFIPILASVARSNGLKTIASLWPANAFKPAYVSNVTWRAVKSDGTYYSSDYVLSPFKVEFVDWCTGVVHDLLNRGLDGIDICETDFGNGGLTSTYDVAANVAFSNRFPELVINGTNNWVPSWRLLRTQTMASNFVQRLASAALSRNRECHFTYTWTADRATGDLVPGSAIGDSHGVDFEMIMDLPESGRPEFFSPEVMWQQWVTNSVTNSIFNPQWTFRAVTTMVGRANSRVIMIPHVELDNVTPNTNVPTLAQVDIAFGLAISNAPGIDFYSHDWAFKTPYVDAPYSAGPVISNVFRGSQ